MMNISVKLEGDKYHNLIPLIKGTEKDLSLTTVYDNQQKGTLHIFIKDSGKTIPVDSITIPKIPPAKAGEMDINVSSRIQKRNHLYIKISVNGIIRTTKVIQLNKYIPGKSIRDKLLLALLLLLIAGITFVSVYATKPIKPAQQAEPSSVTETAHQEETSQPVQTALPTPESANLYKNRLPIRLSKPQIIYFTPNSPMLTFEARKELIELIPLLNSVKDHKTSIAGHCALFGTEKGRTELSMQRAIDTLKFLKENGWNPSVKPEVTGFGGRHPVTRNRKKQDLNRRVEITCTSKEP